jgi:putative transposase
VPNRRVRLEGKYAIHHAIPAGNGGCVIVRDDVDRGWLMREIRREVLERGWLLTAFCVMDTHVHLLIETPEPDLSIGIGRIQGRYARRFNKRHVSHGALFHQRYWSRRVDSGGYLVRVAVYVALNRVKPRICAHPSDWSWSSYRETAGLEVPSGLLDLSRLYAVLGRDEGEARREYVALVEEGLARMLNGADPAWEAVGDLVDDRFGQDARSPR